ncbi:hypothetical protein BDV97DRAFT_352386 [Delphinella strobiligena]|nr:hypothetical protein BDV97DRAFT_352386 [Delphinella strobiligena]
MLRIIFHAMSSKAERSSFRKRHRTLFSKAHELEENCPGVQVYVVVQYENKRYRWNSCNDSAWPPSDTEMVDILALSIRTCTCSCFQPRDTVLVPMGPEQLRPRHQDDSTPGKTHPPNDVRHHVNHDDLMKTPLPDKQHEDDFISAIATETSDYCGNPCGLSIDVEGLDLVNFDAPFDMEETFAAPFDLEGLDMHRTPTDPLASRHSDHDPFSDHNAVDRSSCTALDATKTNPAFNTPTRSLARPTGLALSLEDQIAFSANHTFGRPPSAAFDTSLGCGGSDMDVDSATDCVQIRTSRISKPNAIPMRGRAIHNSSPARSCSTSSGRIDKTRYQDHRNSRSYSRNHAPPVMDF